MSAALLVITLGAAVAGCTGVDGRPEGAPVVVTTDALDSSEPARSADAARDQAAQASAAEQSRLAAASASSASSASASAAASSAAEAARVAAERQAAADQARQQAEQEAAASAEAERAAAEQAAAEQAAEDEAQRQAADQAQFDAALASGTCTDAPANRMTECVGIIEDSVPPPGDAGADGASADGGSGGWYDSHGNWVSPETAARAQAKGIPVGGDVPGYLRCGTLCGESPTSGEIQSEWARQQGLIDENGAPTGTGG